MEPSAGENTGSHGPDFHEIRYITFVLLGVCMLWPWNAMLSLTSYMTHDVFKDDSIYAKVYTSTMMTVSTITSVFVNYQLSKHQHGYTMRIKRGLVWQILVFVILAALVGVIKKLTLLIDFLIINALVLVSSIGTAYTQNGSMAWANVYGSEVYSQAIMLGQAIAGVLPSLVFFFLSFIKSGGDSRDTSPISIFFYYIATAAISVSCFGLFKYSKIGVEAQVIKPEIMAAPVKYSSHNESISSETQPNATSENDTNDTSDTFIMGEQIESSMIRPTESVLDENRESQIPLSLLYAKLKYLVLAIFLSFAATLLFPVFAANTYVSNLPLQNAQFIPLAFTVWNLGDLYGRLISSKYAIFKNQKLVNPSNLFIYSILRIMIIPFFFTCNLFGHIENPFFLQDMWYLSLLFLFGLSNGNCVSLSFMLIGDQLGDDDELKAAAGGFSLIFVSTGLTFGSVLSYLFVFIINKVYSK